MHFYHMHFLGTVAPQIPVLLFLPQLLAMVEENTTLVSLSEDEPMPDLYSPCTSVQDGDVGGADVIVAQASPFELSPCHSTPGESACARAGLLPLRKPMTPAKLARIAEMLARASARRQEQLQNDPSFA